MSTNASPNADGVAPRLGQSEELSVIRQEIRRLCESFPNQYWRGLEPDRYPEEFVAALTAHGWLAALIPERVRRRRPRALRR